jgi:hypothetical protein
MQRVKYAMMLIVTALACVTGASTEAATPPGGGQKTIGFTLVSDFNKKAPEVNAAIFFAYYDPNKREWQKSSQRTDSRGRRSFTVPSGKQGESYTFLYAIAQDELDKAIKEVNDDKRAAWRIPPGEQAELELLIDGRNQSNTRGSVQMWGIP